ncbi:Sterile alpha motif (SAM) domain-containing protein [Zea mays]|uniref:Sterile alpha motif (SAM) domain-containing protein n=1 Tax=Zea mays TaxID=4577 RepID=A0A1D6MQF5_MAIZE|nr:Sterile alpha motif (SAM) domain-containing protein [Zea mays]
MAFRSHYTLQEMLWQTARANQEPEDSTQNSWNNRESGQSSGRFCQDDGTWRRELYKDSRGTQTSSELTSRNLQSNKKSQAQQKVVKKLPVSDLRGKLSGVASQRPQLSSTVQVPKPVKEVIKSNKPVQKRDPTPTTTPPDIKKPSAPAPVPAPSALPKQSQNKIDASLDSLLKSLDLEKYLINFQAEEAHSIYVAILYCGCDCYHKFKPDALKRKLEIISSLWL